MTSSTTPENVLMAFYAQTYPGEAKNGASPNTMFQELDSLSRVELFERLKGDAGITIALEDFLRAPSWEVAMNGTFAKSGQNAVAIKLRSPSEAQGKQTDSGVLILFSLWAYTLFGLLSVVTLAALLLPLALEARKWIVHLTARTIFFLTGTKILIQGEIPKHQVIAVSNHESYLDSIVLYAALPPKFHFIAKEELTSNLLLKMFLTRIGTYFIDRNDLFKAAESTKELRVGLRERFECLHIFPEGTFVRDPGLLPFKHGAFYLSALEKVPVVPLQILGTRKALPPGSWILRRHAISIDIGDPMYPRGDSWDDIVELRQDALSWLSRD